VAARSYAADLADLALAPFGRALLLNHARHASRLGLERVVVVLSFDCDTDRDIEVASDVHARLADVGVGAGWAVPGELLERGAETYCAIAASGAEMLSHGYRQHCEIDASGAYVSTYFYGARADVEADIRRGHDAHLRVLGRQPRGFRVPHFGEFQRPDQLRFLHSILQSLGYRYSSSTMPTKWLLRGPIYDTGAGLVELPVSGRRSTPRRVLDTWSFRFAPNRTVGPDDYLYEVRSLLSFFVDRGRPAVLNLYADPSQVADWPEWFDLVSDLAPYTAPSFGDLLDSLP
jgi:peptidoglycan/xylan/chitin deacetylase (PgdA/CDA1 family)